MDYTTAIKFVLEMEGGYNFHKSDPGGATKYGISAKSYPHLDIKSLDRDIAIQIYYQDYWLPCKCDILPDKLDLVILDSSVNLGCSQACKLLQACLGLKMDGRIGPITLLACQGRQDLINDYLFKRLSFYTNLKTFDKFGSGWVSRVISLRNYLSLTS